MRRILTSFFVLVAMALPATAGNVADCTEKGKDTELVITSCTALINSGMESPKNVVIFYGQRALAYTQQGQDDKAGEDYSNILKLNPDDADIHSARALLALNKAEKLTEADNSTDEEKKEIMTDYYNAIDDYKAAIKLKPDNPDAYFNLGRAQEAVSGPGSAIEDYGQAIAVKSDYFEAYYLRGYAYLQIGKNDRAMADFDHAISLKPEVAAPYYYRGQVSFAVGDFDKAKKDYEKTLTLTKDEDIIAATKKALDYIASR